MYNQGDWVRTRTNLIGKVEKGLDFEGRRYVLVHFISAAVALVVEGCNSVPQTQQVAAWVIKAGTVMLPVCEALVEKIDNPLPPLNVYDVFKPEVGHA